MLKKPVSGMFTRTTDPTNLDKVLSDIKADFTAIKTTAYDVKVDPITGKTELKANPFMSNIIHKENNVIIGAASADYGLVQYKDAVGFLKDMMENKEVIVPLASLTFGGARLHLLCTTDETINLPGNDTISCFFSVSTSHNRSLSMTVSCTPVHGGSQTIFTPFSNSVVEIRHTVNVEERMRQAKVTLTKVKDFWKKYADMFHRLANTECDSERRTLLLEDLMPGDSTRVVNVKEKITDIFNSGPTSTLASCKETLFGLVIAIQIYADYYKTVRTNKFGYDEVSMRVESRLTGDGAKLKAKSFQLAVEKIDSFAIGLKLAGIA